MIVFLLGLSLFSRRGRRFWVTVAGVLAWTLVLATMIEFWKVWLGASLAVLTIIWIYEEFHGTRWRREFA